MLTNFFKIQTHNCVANFLQAKINSIQANLDSLKESAANETKSTAGDKHETALAMLQIEQANNRTQLQKLLEQKTIMKKIDSTITNSKIGLGSLVETNKGLFYLSIALGKVEISEKIIFTVSVDAPLGKAIIGKQINDIFFVNNSEYKIINFI